MASVSLEMALPATGAAGRETERETLGVDQSQALERFLTGIERRAYRIARMAVRNDDDALDIVQDAMIRLARNYGARPTEQWRPLFYRILNNGIRDCIRRRRVRSRVMAWWPGAVPGQEDRPDPIEEAPDPAGRPDELLESAESLAILGRASRRCRKGSVRRSCCGHSRDWMSPTRPSRWGAPKGA